MDYTALTDAELAEVLAASSAASVSLVGLVTEPQSVGSTGYVGSVGSFSGVLTDVRAWLARYISVVDDLDLDLLTLWAAHTHLAFETYTTPRLVVDSSMPGSGKTTVLEHLSRLCMNPIQAASLSSPALLTRMLNQSMRTILIDEVNRSLDPKKPGVEEIIAVLNSGYKRGATRPVLVPGKGGEWVVSEMPTFSPVAMAGNAPALPDDTQSRCIRVLLMPDLEGRVESSDWEEIEEEAEELGRRLAYAAEEAREFVRTVRPELPAGCIGRTKERWNPIKRVAAAAGGNWTAIADELIKRDVAEAEMDKEDGINHLPPAVVLLKDIRDVWESSDAFTPSSVLIQRLIQHNPAMWGQGSSYGKELNAQRLGRMLVIGFKLHSARQGDSRRGYFRTHLEVVWRRMGMTPLKETDGSDETAATDVCPLHADVPKPHACYTCENIAAERPDTEAAVPEIEPPVQRPLFSPVQATGEGATQGAEGVSAPGTALLPYALAEGEKPPTVYPTQPLEGVDPTDPPRRPRGDQKTARTSPTADPTADPTAPTLLPPTTPAKSVQTDDPMESTGPDTCQCGAALTDYLKAAYGRCFHCASAAIQAEGSPALPSPAVVRQEPELLFQTSEGGNPQ